MHRAAYAIVVVISCATTGWAQEVNIAKESQPVGPLPVEKLARKIEPDLVGRPERLMQYVDFFRREVGNDARLFAFDVTATQEADGRVQLIGYIEFPESRSTLVSFLTAMGFDVDDQLESLPAESLGEKRFGLVKVAHALSYDRPRGRRGIVTDCLLGEPLYLLREDGDHILVHSGDGYLGYVPAADIHRVDEVEFAKYLDGPRLRMTSEYDAGNGLVIPAAARLKAATASHGSIVCELPTGASVSLPTAACKVAKTPDTEIDGIIKNAVQLVGTPYQWGGKTSDGVDCSGLVQIGFATAGLYLPRDSNQQVYLGRLTATRWHRAGMRRGDTLYFLGSDGRIRHTALYLGDDQFVQAVVPRVTISSFNPEHANFDASHVKSFAFAKRLID